MDFTIKQLEDGSYSFMIDRTMYSREAVVNASYKFLDKAFFKFGVSEKLGVEIIIKLKDDQSMKIAQEIADEFCNEIIDQQIRCDLDVRCGKIKNLIYEKAFAALRVDK